MGLCQPLVLNKEYCEMGKEQIKIRCQGTFTLSAQDFGNGRRINLPSHLACRLVPKSEAHLTHCCLVCLWLLYGFPLSLSITF